MSLGAGIGSAVFVTARHRRLVMAGADPVDAVAGSLATNRRRRA
jgi:hypothetical protein